MRLALVSLFLLFSCSCSCGDDRPGAHAPVDAGDGCMTEREARQQFGIYADTVVRIQAPTGGARSCTLWTFKEAPGVDVLEYECSADYGARRECGSGGTRCFHARSHDAACDYGWWRFR